MLFSPPYEQEARGSEVGSKIVWLCYSPPCFCFPFKLLGLNLRFIDLDTRFSSSSLSNFTLVNFITPTLQCSLHSPQHSNDTSQKSVSHSQEGKDYFRKCLLQVMILFHSNVCYRGWAFLTKGSCLLPSELRSIISCHKSGGCILGHVLG